MIRDGQFRKADASERTGCVEVAAMPRGGIRVRDSKRPTDGTLSCTDQEWHQFVQSIKAGRFNLPAR
jgi:hypothetical protein